MNENQKQQKQDEKKRKLVLRKQAIRTLDDRELSLVVGGMEPPIIGDAGGNPKP